MVKLKKDPQGVYQTNVLAVNTQTGLEERVTIRRCPTNQKMWDLHPLADRLSTKSEAKSLLVRSTKAKRFDEWEIKWGPPTAST